MIIAQQGSADNRKARRGGIKLSSKSVKISLASGGRFLYNYDQTLSVLTENKM